MKNLADISETVEVSRPIFILAIFIFLIFLVRWLMTSNKDPDSKFDSSDLLLGEDGRASKSAVVMYITLGVSSFIVIYQTVVSSLSDAVFLAYCGVWATPAVTALITNAIKATPPSQPAITVNVEKSTGGFNVPGAAASTQTKTTSASEPSLPSSEIN